MDDEAAVQLPGVWGESSTPVLVANQFSLLGTGPNEFFLTVGQMIAPLTGGASLEERREQLEKLSYVAISPIGRFSLTEQRLRELHIMLTSVIEQIDAKESA